MKTGVVFSVEEFAIHDGPGIRSTIFLKGCPLRCAWCHNPEGIALHPEIMVKKGEQVLCGYRMSSGELANLILKDSQIFELNKGGVTFSGGEPLLQSDFLIDVLQRIKPKVHVAIETSGFAKSQVFRDVITMFDLVMFDIKHTDPILHKRYTGVDNKLILQNLELLCASSLEFIIRIPLIPGVNDDLENMTEIVRLIKDAPNLQRVEFLKYHKTAGAKYEMIGQQYLPPFDENRSVNLHSEIFDENKIKTIIL